MPVEIRLKKKYRSAHRGRYKSNHNMQGTRHQRYVKIGREKHASRYGEPVRRVMVLLATGKIRMMTKEG